MGSIQNTVHYCCVAKGNRILYAYGNEDHEAEALLCLEKAPPFHKWYIETIRKRTFCFLIEDEHVYFSITNENVGRPEIVQFLEHFRDEFKKVTRKGARGSFLNMNTVVSVEDHLVPVIRKLIASLESVSHNVVPSPSPISSGNGQTEVTSSTKAPLLGKSHKQETTKKKKKKTKDHVITVRDDGPEEHRKSTDKGVANSSSTSAALDSTASQSGAGSLAPLQKDLGPTRIRSSSQSIQKKWWRQVRIVLAIDAVVCLVLFAIWLGVCHGINCVR